MPNTPSPLRLSIFLLPFLLLFSCDQGIFKSGLEEGVIEYEVSYPDLEDDHLMMDLLPKKMKSYFANGGYKNEITAGMGLFRSSIIYDGNENQLFHTYKLLNTKMVSELNPEDIHELNQGFQDLEFEETGTEKVIAGYNCKEVKVDVKADSSWSFMLYYTTEIDVPKANYRNPFEEIDGVLMQYDLLNQDLHMRLKAVKVMDKEVDLKDIRVDEEFEKVSSARLRKELESIFQKVQ